MEIKIEHLSRVAFAVSSRGHMLVSDQPASNGGGDVGMTPPELLLASLGTCIGYYVREFCEARDLVCDGFQVQVEGDSVPDPPRIGRIRISIRLPFELDEKRAAALLRAAGHCTIHNTLRHSPEMEFQLLKSEPSGTPAGQMA